MTYPDDDDTFWDQSNFDILMLVAWALWCVHNPPSPTFAELINRFLHGAINDEETNR